MSNIPEPAINKETEDKLEEVGDIEYCKIPFRKGTYWVYTGFKEGNKQCQAFEEYEHAVIFAEIIKKKQKAENEQEVRSTATRENRVSEDLI